jgi:hypothetical protein
MKKIFAYIKEFHKGYFNLQLYLVVLLFIALLIAINYTQKFELGFINQYSGSHFRTILFYLVHAISYYGVLLIIHLFDRRMIRFTWSFWIKSTLGLLILATDRSVYPMLARWVLSGLPSETYRFYGRILVNTYGFAIVLGLLSLLKVLFDRRTNDGLYGLTLRNVDFKPYWIMLLIMVPLVYAASWLPDFIQYYPTYKRAGGDLFATYHQIPEWMSKAIYETVYVADFLNTELFFRGFLIIGLSRLLGKNVVLPMVATYVVLHFGKPLGETISSIFGGYLLGIIAFYSRNIWGGVFIHGGIALLMELFAFGRM